LTTKVRETTKSQEKRKSAKDPGRLDMIGDATLSIMMVTSGRAASSLDLQLGRIKKIRSTVLTMQARKVDKSSSKNPCAVIQGAIIKKRGQKMPQAKVPLPPTWGVLYNLMFFVVVLYYWGGSIIIHLKGWDE